MNLKALTKRWQTKLGLSDWTLTVRLVRASEMNGENRVGECIHHLESKTALIRILEQVEHEALVMPHTEQKWDLDRILVHELIHLSFAPFEIVEGPGQIAQEQAINALAKALTGY